MQSSEANRQEEIAEHRRTRDALEQSQCRLQAIFDNALEAILLADDEGRYVDANPAACALLGYSREELLKMAVSDVAPTLEREITPQLWQQYITEGRLSGEYTILRKDGTTRETEFRAVANILPGLHLSVLRDVTERKRMEESLRRNEMWLRTIISSAPLILWAMDREGVVTLSEGRGLEALGFRSGELVGQSVFDLYHDMPEILELDRRVLAGEEFSSRTKVGAVELESRWVPLHDDQGGITGAIGVALDITERARVEAALRESEERFAKVFHSSPIAIGITTVAVGITTVAEGHFLDVNESLLRLYGYRREEVIGHTALELNMAQNPSDRAALLHKLHEQGTLHNVEHTFRTKSGELRDGITSLELIELNGEACILALTLDITERKRAEEQLNKTVAQLIETQRLAHVGSWERDLATDIITWSDELYDIFGVQPGEFSTTYTTAINRVHPADREDISRILDQAARDCRPFSYKGRVLRPDGTERIVYTRGAVAVDEAGKPIRLFGTAQDVTEQQRSEESLRQSHEQLRALAARQESALEAERTRIAREIHDQFGQALSALKMDLGWLSDHLSMAREEELRHKMAAMTRLIDSSIQAVREIATDLRPAMLDDLGLEAAIEAQAQRFEERTGISCAFTTQVDGLSLSAQQATTVFRILQEALTNVARHAGANHVDVRLQRQAGNLLVEITDDGRGITPAEITDLHSLGLLGMRERAHLIGGEIQFGGRTIDSQERSQGTTVTICIPLQNVAQ